MTPASVSHGRSRAFVIAIFLAALVLCLNGALFQYLPVDDSFISYRYALHLADGEGLVYNIGERVEGYTNFLWILILAAGTGLGGDPVLLGTLLGGLFSVLTIVATYVLARSRFERDDLGLGEHASVLAGGAALLVAAAPGMAVFGFCGLETPLFAFLVTVAVHLASDPAADTKRRFALAAVLFLATLTRPEGAMVFGLILLGLPSSSKAISRGWFRERVTLALFYGVPFIAYLAWKLAYFGSVIPNTAVAKIQPGIATVLAGFGYVAVSWYDHGIVGCGLFLLLSLVTRELRRELRLVHVLLFVYSLYVGLVGGDFFPLGRFIVPVIPLYAVAVMAGVGEAAKRLGGGARATVASTPGLAVCSVALALAVASRGYASRAIFVSHQLNPVFRYIVAGKWLAANANPDDVIACSAAGAIAYYPDLRTIDLLGLTDPVIARGDGGESDRFVAGHSRSNPRYVIAQRPNYVFVPNVWHRRQPMSPTSVVGGIHGEQELAELPEFRDNYHVVNIAVDGKYLGYWKRND